LVPIDQEVVPVGKNINPKDPVKANAAVASNVNEQSRLSLRKLATRMKTRRMRRSV
jgi:hypothetical protein